MKHITIIWLCLTSFVCVGQTIQLQLKEEVKEIQIFSENLNGYLNYECSFDYVYQYESDGWTVTDYEQGLINPKDYVVAYHAYSLIRQHVPYEVVTDLYMIEPEFLPTLYWIGCKGYNYFE